MRTSYHSSLARECFPLGLLVIVGAAIVVVASILTPGVTAQDAPGNFFLKASKSVPRIGRRSEYDNFFLKASKSVPRIGRRRELAPLTEGRDWGSLPWFRTSDNIPGPSRRSDYYIHEEGQAGQPLSWNDVEKTMEESPELWKPDAWRKHSDSIPLRDDFEIQNIVRRSAGQFKKENMKRAAEEARRQSEV